MSSIGSPVTSRPRKDCFSCWITSGLGLTGTGCYVYFQIRKLFSPGFIPPATFIPIMFSVCLITGGGTILMIAADDYFSKR